ncbi:hypothetical protein EJB05_02993, partial [Eragrostis curvula]
MGYCLCCEGLLRYWVALSWKVSWQLQTAVNVLPVVMGPTKSGEGRGRATIDDLEPTMLLMCDAAVDHARFPDKLCARRRILCFLKRCHLHAAAPPAGAGDGGVLRHVPPPVPGHDRALGRAHLPPTSTASCRRQRLCRPPSSCTYRLHIYQVLGTIADGGNRVNDIDRLYPLLDDTAAKYRPHVAALRVFFHDVRKRPPSYWSQLVKFFSCRDVASWMHGWKTAAEKLQKLALKCPELEGKLHLPSPHYAPKRWQINLSGVRPTRKAYKEKGNKPKACDISCLYEQKRQEVNKRLSVPPYRSGFSSNETSGSVISDMQIELAVPQGKTT